MHNSRVKLVKKEIVQGHVPEDTDGRFQATAALEQIKYLHDVKSNKVDTE